MTASYVDSHKKADKGVTYDKHYDEAPWRRFLWHREQLAMTKLLDEFFKNQEINLLDFACGTGRIAGFLENRVSQATGVDVSESMLNEARQKLTRTELICADITKDNVLKDRKFNLITAFRFFLNAESALRKAVLETLVGLLDENGFLVFNNHRNSTSPLVRFAYRRRKKRNFMSMAQMSEMVGAAGLEIVRIYPIGFLPIRGITLPGFVNHAIDNVAAKFNCLQNYSESPIVVCRRLR
jgi:predicted TPR repeat methyltransferase